MRYYIQVTFQVDATSRAEAIQKVSDVLDDESKGEAKENWYVDSAREASKYARLA